MGAVSDVESPGGDERPVPQALNVVAATGALMTIAGLVAWFTRLPADHRRPAGVALSLLIALAGGATVLVARDRPAGIAGLALSTAAIAPLAYFATVNPHTLQRPRDATLALAVATLLWGALFLLPTGPRHPLHLGAALVGVWLVVVVQFGGFGTPFFPLFPFGRSTSRSVVVSESMAPTTLPALSTLTPPNYAPPSDSPPPYPPPTYAPSPPSLTPYAPPSPTFGSSSSSSASSSPFSDDGRPPVAGAGAGAGALLGFLYLLAAVSLDGVGKRRWATAFVAIGDALLLLGVSGLSPRLGAGWSAAVALFAGALMIVAGALGRRRLTAWLGALVAAGAVVGGTAYLVRSPVGVGTALVAIGVAVVALAEARRFMIVPDRASPMSAAPDE